MGSLLKEYLTKELDENNDSNNNNSNKEETNASEDLKDEKDEIKEEIEELKEQEESNCVTENDSSMMHRFDNVVAIVDPPRVGLHPTVSNNLFVICTCSSYGPFIYKRVYSGFYSITGQTGKSKTKKLKKSSQVYC